MSVDLTLYLLKPTVTQIDQVVPDEKQGVDGFEPVDAREAFLPDTPVACWVKKNQPKPTTWCAWLEEGFDFGNKRPESLSSGCAVLLLVSGRIFAACFGTGRHAIPDELVEPDFGLTVALNEVNPKRLRTLVTKSIDVRTRQRDTHQVLGADVPEFALDLDVEWLRAAAGRTDRTDCNVVAGAESLRLQGWNRPLSDLPVACTEFLTISSGGVPEAFKFADSVKPLQDDDPLVAALEGDLQAALQLRFFEHLSIGVDAKVANDAHECWVTYPGSGPWQIDGLDDEALRKGLDQLAAAVPAFDYAKVKLRLLDVDGDEVLNRRLADLIQMEIDRGGDWYVRIERRWLRCREDYVKRVTERVNSLPDLTSALGLPPWNTSAAVHPREEDYNAHVAANKAWLLQDQEFWYHGGEKVEPCDLLTPDRHFIHVKKGLAASDLSHLFGQASGSADLLHRHAPFITEMKGRFEKQWPGTVFEKAGRPKVVLAIARPPGGDIFGKMLLSKINVLEHARRIQGRGFEFAICRVDLAGGSP
jgi:uncharacterized protein (TIGR04141 family)